MKNRPSIQILMTLFCLFGLGNTTLVTAQKKFTLQIEAVNIYALPSLHSYAHAQYDGKWLILGGVSTVNPMIFQNRDILALATNQVFKVYLTKVPKVKKAVEK